MTIGDALLFAVIGIMAGNYVVMRLPGWERRLWLFWLFQGLNFGVILFLLLEGIPALEGPLRVFNYVFALLMMLRVVQNNTQLSRSRVRGSEVQETEAKAKSEALRRALERGRSHEAEAEAEEGAPPPA